MPGSPPANLHASTQAASGTLGRMLSAPPQTPAARMQFYSIFPAPTQPQLIPGSGALVQEPDRSGASACFHQRVPAASEFPSSEPSWQPRAGPGRAGKPKR